MTREDIQKFVSDGFEAAKGGDAIKIYTSVREIYASGKLPAISHYPFGWIIYYALHQSGNHDILCRKLMLSTYLRLNVAKPHKLHSMILTEAIRLYKDAANAAFNGKERNEVGFSIVKFLMLWNPEHLRPGDWRRKELDGKMLTSTVEKLITAYVDEMEKTRVIPERILVDIVDKALAEYPDSPNLYAQRAMLYEIGAEVDKARETLKKALLLAPGKFYLWSKMAAMVAPEQDMRLHVALLYKALNSPGPEQFKGRIMLSLASCLADRGIFPEALWELDKVRKIYKANGWHLPYLCETLSAKVPKGTVASDPERLYRRVAHLADEFLYSSLPTVKMKKSYHKNPDVTAAPGRRQSAWRLTDASGANIWFNPQRFGISPELPMGTTLDVALFNGKVVRASVSPADTL